MHTAVQCSCGAVEMQLTGKPMVQYFCHCDDCQAVHGKAYPCSLYPAPAVSVKRGETDAFTLRTSPRTKCRRCGTYLFAEVPGHGVRGVNADLLPEGMFNPEFHIQCRYATARIESKMICLTTKARQPVSKAPMNSCSGEFAPLRPDH
jgi:hypothetical protein